MFLIAGSGRSGTSAVAQLLHHAGLAVGHDLIEPDASNEEGYFEERRLVLINDAILHNAGLDVRFPRATRRRVIAAAAPHLDLMRELAANATPAWKDPRLSWTLEAWLGVFPDPPRMIVCLRSPAEVIASTMRYFGVEDSESKRAIEHLWRAQYQRLLRVIGAHNLDAVSVEFGELHADPAAAVAPLERFIGRKLDVAHIRRDLRHHELKFPKRLRPLYDRVLALADPWQPTATSQADEAAR